MRDMESLHLEVIRLCDCYAETDPLREMAVLNKDKDKDEAALKWVALAVLHGVDRSAEEITLSKGADGSIKVAAEYRATELPTPGRDIGTKIIDSLRKIAHIEGAKGELPLALGIRDSNIEIKVKVKQDKTGEKVTLKFGK
jgi:hypothetical protein